MADGEIEAGTVGEGAVAGTGEKGGGERYGHHQRPSRRQPSWQFWSRRRVTLGKLPTQIAKFPPKAPPNRPSGAECLNVKSPDLLDFPERPQRWWKGPTLQSVELPGFSCARKQKTSRFGRRKLPNEIANSLCRN